MRIIPAVVAAFLAAAVLPACDDASAPRGGFSVLSCQVDDLPGDETDQAVIARVDGLAPQLDAFDLVALQEDFPLHARLVGQAPHLFVSRVGAGGDDPDPRGDGLHDLASFYPGHLFRIAWEDCHGEADDADDCALPRGFTYRRLTLKMSLALDIYQVRLDNGDQEADRQARAAQVAQLSEFMFQNSFGNQEEIPLLVTGLTPLDDGVDQEAWEALADRNNLTMVPLAGQGQQVWYRGNILDMDFTAMTPPLQCASAAAFNFRWRYLPFGE